MDTHIDTVPITLSSSDFDVLHKAFGDKNFCRHLQDFAKNISDPKNLNHYESELKKLGKESGIDITLLQSSPGISLIASLREEPSKVFLNISVSDKINKPDFSCSKENGLLKWYVPHAILKPRLEFNLENVFSKGNNINQIDEKTKEYINTTKKDGIWVYELIVNPLCIDLAKENGNLRENLINIVKESMKKKMNIDLVDERILGFGLYIGQPTVSQMKSFKNSELCDNDSSENLFGKISEDIKNLNNINKDALSKNIDNITPLKPSYKLKHVNRVSLQDYSILKSEYPESLRPQTLLLEVKLPGVKSASDIDVDIINNKELCLKTLKGIKYNLELNLPYEVEEEPENAKYDISTFLLKVELIVKKFRSQLSSDSGIDCDNEYRTNSDTDNLSVSSSEESDIKNSSPGDDMLSDFHFNQVDQFMYISMDCDNINTESIKLKIIDSNSFKYIYENVNKNENILLISVNPHLFKDDGVTYHVLGKNIWIKVEKREPDMWHTVEVKRLKNNLDDNEMSQHKSIKFKVNCKPELIPQNLVIENKNISNPASAFETKVNNDIENFEISPKDELFYRKVLLPHCNLSETQNFLSINIHCENADIKNILIVSINSKMFQFQYKHFGSGCVPLFYGGYVNTSPYAFKTNGISHNILDNSLSIQVEKRKPHMWNKIRLGVEPKKLRDVTVKNFVNSQEQIHSDSDYKANKQFRRKKEFKNSEDSSSASLKESEHLDNSKTTEDGNKKAGNNKSCEIDIPQPSGKTECFATSSWPRGILKSRSRSLSDSHLDSPMDTFGNAGFSTSLGCYEYDLEMSEENELPIGSSPKKSVRFNEFVCKQVFRVNSSIVGQKAKSQKKALQRKRTRERKILSEGSQSSETETVTDQSDIASTNEEDSNTDAENDTKSSKKGKSNESASRTKINGRKKRENSNKKSRKNKKPVLSLSNEMVFQLDDD